MCKKQPNCANSFRLKTAYVRHLFLQKHHESPRLKRALQQCYTALAQKLQSLAPHPPVSSFTADQRSTFLCTMLLCADARASSHTSCVSASVGRAPAAQDNANDVDGLGAPPVPSAVLELEASCDAQILRMIPGDVTGRQQVVPFLPAHLGLPGRGLRRDLLVKKLRSPSCFLRFRYHVHNAKLFVRSVNSFLFFCPAQPQGLGYFASPASSPASLPSARR